MKKKNNVFGIDWLIETVIGMLIIPLFCLYVIAPTDKTMAEVKQEQTQVAMGGTATPTPSFFESLLDGLLDGSENEPATKDSTKKPKLTALEKKKQVAYEAGQAQAQQQVQLMRKKN